MRPAVLIVDMLEDSFNVNHTGSGPDATPPGNRHGRAYGNQLPLVLSSALDALANEFCAYIIEDCSASYSLQIHEAAMTCTGGTPLFPLFKIITLEEFLKDLD